MIRKRSIAALIVLVAGTSYGAAVYTKTIVNVSALAVASTYTLNLNSTPTPSGIDRLSAQINYSSATIAAVAFSTTAYSLNGNTITSPSHGMPLGLAVLYSTGTNIAIGGLTNQTTYYVNLVDANTLQLASSQLNAVNGTFITLTSTSSVSASWTLTPLAISGTPTLTWQVSNDCVSYANWNGAAVIRINTPYKARQVTQNLGRVNYQCVQLAVSPPTTGAIVLKATLNGKD
jgi:hypothetical protein